MQKFNKAAAVPIKMMESRVVPLRAALGPPESKTFPYHHSKSKLNGLTIALAKGKAAVDEKP